MGAGASQYYGYPSGRELVKTILSFLDKDNPANCINRFITEFGIEDEDYILSFRKELFLANIMSIDEYLEYRTEFIRIGKLSIAIALIPYEEDIRLFDLNKRDNSWYEYLLSKLRALQNKLKENQLSVITFNYDRSLEHYLFTSLKHTYGIKEEECAEILNSIPIIHVYGKLNCLPWQDKEGRPYKNNPSSSQIVMASDNIFMMSEDREGSMIFAHASSLLGKAQVVYFLGFGYHDMNLKRLNISSLGDKQSFGTSYGLGTAEIVTIKEKWSNVNPLADNTADILSFLKNYYSLK